MDVFSEGWYPLIIAFAGIVIALVFDLAFREKAREWVTITTVLTLVGTALGVLQWNGYVTDHFNYNTFYVTFALIGLFSSLLVVVNAHKEYRHELDLGVFFSLLIVANIGGLVVASAKNFIALYIGYELFSISSYAMVAFKKRNRPGAESAMKIVLLGALSSAIIVYGLSMYYGATGTLMMGAEPLEGARGIWMAAVGLIVAGSGFKIGLVPFHFWIADIYSGAPSSMVTFLAASSKKMAFAFVIQIFFVGMVFFSEYWSPLLAILAALSMLLGNIAAVYQNNVMRMLAYSTIAQAGYIVIGLAAYGSGIEGALKYAMIGILFHIIAHVLMKGAMIIATYVVIDNYGNSDIGNFKGLLYKHPIFAGTIVIALLSLMGIPPTFGFVGKLFLFYSAVAAEMTYLAVIGAIGSAISIYYYGRIIRIMTERDEEDKARISISSPILALLIILSILTIVLIVFSANIADLAETIVQDFPMP